MLVLDDPTRGVDIGANTLENAAELFRQDTDLVLHPSMGIVECDGRKVLAVQVSAGIDKPYTFKGQAFKRVGRTTQPLSRGEYERLLLERHRNGYESLPAIGSRCEDLDVAVLDGFLSARAPRAWQAGADLKEKGKAIAEAGLPMWFLHNDEDQLVSIDKTKNFVSAINSFNPKVPAKLTIFPPWGLDNHDAWTKASDPAYREDGMNIYEWMLRYKRSD